MSTNPAVNAIVQLLARYLRDNPNACDTADAIARWWLGPGVVSERPTLEAALAWLTQHALVETVHATDGRVRYQRARSGPQADAEFDALLSHGILDGSVKGSVH